MDAAFDLFFKLVMLLLVGLLLGMGRLLWLLYEGALGRAGATAAKGAVCLLAVVFGFCGFYAFGGAEFGVGARRLLQPLVGVVLPVALMGVALARRSPNAPR